MTILTGRGAALVSVSALALSLSSGAAWAQQAPATPPQADTTLPQTTTTSDKEPDIVVTGSRIHRSTFNSASPVDVITRDDRVLAGARTTAEQLQSSTVTSGTSQINGSFLGFVSEGGPAASTIGLRGLGSSRTLVLLNGRRLAPAGAGPQLVSADLNTLPTAVVSSIEVLHEGASSVYGSDAIAGVVNVITDTKLNGIVADAFTDQPIAEGGGGRTYRLSVTAGHVFERGHILASVEYREQTGLRVGDRAAFSCPRDLYYNSAGMEIGQLDPATGKLMCFPYTTNGGSGIASGYGIAQSFTLPLSRETFVNGDINNPLAVNGLTRTSPSPQQLNDDLLSPVRTLTGYINGAYELGMLGDAEIYAEGLFTRRESHQDSTYQFNLNGVGLSPNIQKFGGNYYGTPLSAFGYPVSPFFPNSLANAGYNVFTPFIVPNRQTTSSQQVDYYRINGGLRGSFGIGDWKYDANFQWAKTDATYSLQQILTSHLNNSLQAVVAPAGTPASLITKSIAGQGAQFPGDTTFPAGTSYTCAVNVSHGAFVAGSTCVPFNMYDPAAILGGQIPDNVFNYLFGTEVGHTTFRQQTVSLNIDGTLFELPAGPLKAAFGYEHRFDYINDTPSVAAQTGDLYNFSSSGITTGSDYVDELYGELDIPLVKDKPFFHDLEANVSGRFTHYRSYGSDETFHINAQWSPVEVLRFRGNYGTSFRAPNLFEQYVANQTGFAPPAADPCSSFGSLATTSTVYQNCLAQLTPILGAAATSFIATSGPMETTEGGAGRLKAEHSTAYGFGAVLTLPKSVADLSFSVDYFHINVKDEVQVLGTLILSRCYEATDFGPNNPYCALIAPRRPASDAQKGNLLSFQNPYLNVSQQGTSGIDFDLRYGTPLFGGKFLAEAQATWVPHQTFQLFATDPVADFAGTLGVQGAGAGPKWTANLDLRYTVPGDNITFRWGIQYVGPQDSSGDVDPTLSPAPFLGVIVADLRAEAYINNGASIQFKWKDVGQVTIGMNNIFNVLPPMISSFPTTDGQFVRIGNYLNSSNYDILGRSIFMNVTRSFR